MENRIRQQFSLLSALLTQRRALTGLEEELRQGRFALRQAQQERTLYPGSFRYFLDKLSGKAPDKQEELDRQVRQAEAALSGRETLRHSLLQDIEDLNRELEACSPWETIPAEGSAEDRRLWAELEQTLCAQALLPLLDQTEQALKTYRSQLRGELTDPAERFEKGTEHIARAEACAAWLSRLKKAMEILEEPFEPGAYLENPGFFIDGAAARHNRIDRANQALDQLRQLAEALRGR